MNRTKIIGYWLLLGCFMVFMQVIIGGVTRLTGSGLSITKWEIVVGTIPPTNEADWEEAFLLYQQTPQFQLINQDMLLDEFKFIYFWEWLHRFWARWMGFVFIFPFAFFIHKKWLDKNLLKHLSLVLLWAIVIATFGWIMVASGLIDKPYVSPIKLTLHLSLAMGLFAYLVWLATHVLRRESFNETFSSRLQKLSWTILVLLVLQIFLGGIVSGMKAGLAYPTWPDMNGEAIPGILFNHPWQWHGFLYYEAQDVIGKAIIQTAHRTLAYVVYFLLMYFFLEYRFVSKNRTLRNGILLLAFTSSLQVLLGIITVLNCVGHIPVLYGVLHQGGAMLLLANFIFVHYHLHIHSPRQ